MKKVSALFLFLFISSFCISYALPDSTVIKEPRVKEVFLAYSDNQTNTIQLGQEICVKIENLDVLLSTIKEPTKQLVPVINDVKIMAWVSTFISVEKGYVKFHLIRPDKNDSKYEENYKALASIMGRPFFAEPKAITFTVATLNGNPIKSEYIDDSSAKFGKSSLYLRQLKLYPLYLNLLLYLSICFYVFYTLNKKTSIFRVKIPENLKQSVRINYKIIAYSLADIQLVVWMLLVFGATIFIWISTGEISPLTTGVLTILSIAGGTNIIAKAIASTKLPDASATNVTLVDYETKGLILDIIREGNEYSAARFQQALWTLLFMAYFVHSVWEELAIPEIDSNWLVLMGLSSGIYVVGKGVGKTPTPAVTPAPAQTVTVPVPAPLVPPIKPV